MQNHPDKVIYISCHTTLRYVHAMPHEKICNSHDFRITKIILLIGHTYMHIWTGHHIDGHIKTLYRL